MRKSNGNLAGNGTLYWYMTPGVVAESQLDGALKSEYVFFDGERVARRDGVNGAGGVFYYISDHLKTASVVADSAGTIKAESDYYPWGGELQFVNNDSNHYKFTGKERDGETGLDYFGARYYSNGLGRWVSADWSSTPIPVPYADFNDPQSLNLYQFVGGNPASKADVDGHEIPLDPKSAQTIGENFSRNTEAAIHVLKSIGEFLKRAATAGGQLSNSRFPIFNCSCREPQEQNNNKQNNNNSQSKNQNASGERLPQDKNANPKPPAANNGKGTVGPSPTQNAQAQADAEAARAAGHTDIRMNQQQVNARGERVGINRPDLQSTDANGVRHYTEYDRSSTNADAHAQRTQANDPNGVTHTKIDH
ncbi:MAG TPA: RHS repeat-associated core domain-containing protein [Candidatus Angelobacter sp.]|nr:RHS repeat-associated core domain-containing protein [Candidatus Angelobacter sp.]